MKRFLLLALFCTQLWSADKGPFDKPGFEYAFSGVLKEDMFAADNFSLLNSCNDFDRVWFMRHTLDFIVNATYGRQLAGYPLAEFNFVVRNKGIWGAPQTIAQSVDTEVKVLDVLTGEHNHFFPRQIFWMREGWLRFSVPDAFHLPLQNPHTFILGFFPFQVGRGIALGDAYAVGQDFLGMYTDGLVDQFAPGFKLSGEFVRKHLFYDAYVACLENMSALISDTGAKIRGQEFGHRLEPERGFGRINMLAAGRLRWFIWPEGCGRTVIIEPYVIFNHDPEQDIEFTADAASTLGTFGIAADYVSENVEAGFEYAQNMGFQYVRGWDRNTSQLQNRNGQAIVVNSHVYLGADPYDPAAPSNLDAYKDPLASIVVANGAISNLGKNAQAIIDDPKDQSEALNGKLIGVVPGLSAVYPNVPTPYGASTPDGLYNAKNRYRNPYKNKYKGWMFVVDCAFWLHNKQVKVGFETGIASGDDNPNFQTKDGDFSGFIGLQEVYSGRKVRSAFVLGGAGKIKRPLTIPDPEFAQAPSQFPTNVSGFSNIIYSGMSVNWIPNFLQNTLTVNPNIIAFWQEFNSKKFDRKTKRNLNQSAHAFLGLEGNLFMYYNLFSSLRLFLISSVFFPGQHYTDLKGIPLNSDQNKRLDRYNASGFEGDRVPNQGDNTAFTFNVGLEYKF